MAISSLVKYIVEPTTGMDIYVLTYTKANTTDTINLATYTPIKTIVFAKAQVDAVGADDPFTVSGTTITLSTGTGAGRLFVVGKS